MCCSFGWLFGRIKIKTLSFPQQIIRPLSNPIKETGHIQILYGNLAPEGSVAKITGKEGLYFSGDLCCNNNIPADKFSAVAS